MFPGVYPPFTGFALATYFRRYLDEYAVSLVSRPRGLPAGYDADDAAEGHVEAFEELAGADGAVDVIGISMGGMIGQAVARRRPDLVDRLVLANSGCRLDEGARADVRRLEASAREHDWAAIRSALARAMFADGRAIAYPLVLRTVGRFVQPRPAEPADVWRSLEFILGFDGCDALDGIGRPALVFGGDRDPYFTERVARETARGLPDAELELHPGAKHGAFHERKFAFDSAVRSFLDRTA